MAAAVVGLTTLYVYVSYDMFSSSLISKRYKKKAVAFFLDEGELAAVWTEVAGCASSHVRNMVKADTPFVYRRCRRRETCCGQFHWNVHAGKH
jgi:hypothetical protein